MLKVLLRPGALVHYTAVMLYFTEHKISVNVSHASILLHDAYQFIHNARRQLYLNVCPRVQIHPCICELLPVHAPNTSDLHNDSVRVALPALEGSVQRQTPASRQHPFLLILVLRLPPCFTPSAPLFLVSCSGHPDVTWTGKTRGDRSTSPLWQTSLCKTFGQGFRWIRTNSYEWRTMGSL